MRRLVATAVVRSAVLLADALGARDTLAHAAGRPSTQRRGGTGVGSMPPMTGANPLTVPGSRESATSWAQALAGSGKALSDEGFEGASVKCFEAAGVLAAIGAGDAA